MVKGLDIFRAHFRDYADRYVLIGGAACDLSMRAAGLEFRATKDLDIVLCLEALDADFVRAFWAFIEVGGYQAQERSTGRKQFYRFHKPANGSYPYMLELFSRQPDALRIAKDSHLTPIPMEEEVASLSAILMDATYYAFIQAGRRVYDGLPVIGPAHLIPLKARAWLDLTQREKEGQQIDSRTIKKHKNDVFRLYQILDPDVDPAAPDLVKKDLAEFITGARKEPLDLNPLGFRVGSFDDVLNRLGEVYGV